MSDIPSSSPRLAGLDGLRAIAVALVVVYHLFPQWWVRSGFVGVDVFFVISGFLITTLLLDERARSGRIGLAAFWGRRARRLLPALAVLITVCATAAWMIGGDVLVKMGAQIVGAATFGYNWVSIADGSGYFSDGTPELFRNLWSLAVEEQFYVLWPLVLPLILLLRPVGLRVALAMAAATASAMWMASLVTGGADLTRAYFGTDSHSFGILLGVALAFALHGRLRRAEGRMPRPAARAALAAVGVLAVAGIIVVATTAPSLDVETFPGALVAASALTAVAIAAGTWPGSPLGRAVDIRPLRWIGDRSYGIYLWHWPLLVLLVAWVQGTGTDAGVPVGIGLAALVLTVVAAELSYRAIERPVRRHGFRASLRRLGRRLAGTPATRFGALAALAAWAVVLGGTSAAIAAAPGQSSAEAVVLAGEEALAAASDAPASRAPSPGATPTPAPSPAAEHDPGGPPPAPTPQPVDGSQITAIGDSVMLASAPALLERFPGIRIDAKVSRSMWAAAGILEKLEAKGRLRPYVVLALGTNGPIDAGALQRAMRIVGPDRHVVLVNAFAPRSWIAGVNRDIARYAAGHPQVVVADWSRAIAHHVDLLAGDRIHPGMAGGRIFASTVAAAIDGVEQERADAAYRAAVRAYRDAHGLDANLH